MFAAVQAPILISADSGGNSSINTAKARRAVRSSVHEFLMAHEVTGRYAR